MKYKILKNISDKDITDYPIDEAEFSGEGELITDDKGNYKVTGRTLTWTVKSGEKVKLPEYVAKILLDRYGVEDKDSGRHILEEVDGEVEGKPVKVEGIEKDFTCKRCGKSFVSAKGLGLHLAAAHPEDLK